MGLWAGTINFRVSSARRFCKTDMATALAHNDPTVTAESPNHNIVIQARNFGHTASSTTSESGANS
jgi:hypothetical protein